MNELKECPFCGGTGYIDKIQDVYPNYVVRCNGCRTRTRWHEKKADAVDTWNRRPAPENNPCKIMTLDDAIEHCKDKAQSDDACGANHAQLRDWLLELKTLKAAQEKQTTHCTKAELCAAVELAEDATECDTGTTCSINNLPCSDCTPCCGSRREDAENKPLTLEQLDTLDGEPVYIVDTYHGGMPHWAIWDTAMIDNDEARSYGKTWLAYARKRRNHEN